MNLTHGDGEARVEVLDEGPGFPTGFDINKSANNGLLLVAGLTKTDLAALVEYRTRDEDGGSVVVRFPVSDEAAL